MKRSIAAGVAAVLLALASVGQAAPPPPMTPAASQPSAAALAVSRDLLRVMRMKELIDQSMAALMPQLMQSEYRRYQGLTSAQRTAINDAVVDAIRAITPAYLEKAAVIYAQTFTMEELQALLAFYSSPVGQSFLDKQPLILAPLQVAMTSLMPQLEREMEKSLCRRLDCRTLTPAQQQS